MENLITNKDNKDNIYINETINKIYNHINHNTDLIADIRTIIVNLEKDIYLDLKEIKANINNLEEINDILKNKLESVLYEYNINEEKS